MPNLVLFLSLSPEVHGDDGLSFTDDFWVWGQVCWATAKWDSGKRNKRLDPDSDGMACGLSVYTYAGSPSKIRQGVIPVYFQAFNQSSYV